MYIALCLPPTPPILHRLLFSNPLGRTVYSQKDINTIPYAKFAGQTECIMWDSKIVSGKEVSAHPSHLFLTILLYGAMEFFFASHIREFWSRKYPLRACLHQKDRTLVYLLRVLFILLFCKICFLCLTVKPSASRSLSKCRPRGFKSENIE